VAMLVNAFRAEQSLTADDKLATANEVVEKVEPKRWKIKVADDGDGVSLDELGQLIPPVLKAYGVAAVKVEVVHFPDISVGAKEKLIKMLSENERSARDLILINFLQSAATGDPEGAVGHIAPLAAYDAGKGRVLILDPDRQWYEPYWISVDTLLAGMATRDSGGKHYRGLVRVTLEK
jgi:hypothetical protein